MNKNDVLKFAEMIKDSEHTVFFGGAGASTESGLKDYGSENGIYHTAVNYGMSPEEILSHDCFLKTRICFTAFSGISLWKVQSRISHIKLWQSLKSTTGKYGLTPCYSRIRLCFSR